MTGRGQTHDLKPRDETEKYEPVALTLSLCDRWAKAPEAEAYSKSTSIFATSELVRLNVLGLFTDVV